MTRDEVLKIVEAARKNEVRADLGGADLGEANLRGADLGGADLGGANLWGANLRAADLRGANYAITVVLLANLGEVSPELCRDLMRLDASALPDGERLMQEWVDGGACPLNATSYCRVALFAEDRAHWSPGPVPSLWNLWKRLAAEKGVRISGEDDA